MKSIFLQELSLLNFKGIPELVVSFDDITNIYGANGTGKTTVFDGFYWLLFDKDSSNRSKFEIKPLDKSSQVQHGLESTVIGKILINGKLKIFQKTFREKWEKERGTADKRFTGHETLYYINGDPVKMSEYNKAVNDMLDETIFKMLTNPLYFSQTLSWAERRAILISIIGDIPLSEVIKYDPELAPLENILIDSDTETLKKSFNARKKKLNEDVEKIPIRIDECQKSIREIDSAALNKEIEEHQGKLDGIENQLLSQTQLDPAITAKKDKLKLIQAKVSAIESEKDNKKYEEERTLTRDLRKIESDLKESQRVIEDTKSQIKNNQELKENYGRQAEQLRKDWHTEHDKPFELKEDFICPTCHRMLDETEIEKKKKQLQENFNNEKAKNLGSITEKGKNIAEKIKKLEKDITDLETKVNNTESSIETLKISIDTKKKLIQEQKEKESDYGQEHKSLKEEIATLEKEIELPSDNLQQIELLSNQKKELQKQIDRLKSELRQDELNKQMKKRINELEQEEKKVSQKIAEVENQIFLLERFEKTKAEMMESSINKKFENVRFKLFDIQVNGALNPTCEVLVDGVPFSDANNAGKFNAGIDIINTLSDHYKITAPIFIDNRESINEIIPTSSQIINLIVTRDKQLKVA
ncbi:MAG: AAA family ATPase [Bacillota bacterium]